MEVVSPLTGGAKSVSLVGKYHHLWIHQQKWHRKKTPQEAKTAQTADLKSKNIITFF